MNCRFSPDVMAAMLVSVFLTKELWLFILFGTPTWPLCLLSFVSLRVVWKPRIYVSRIWTTFLNQNLENNPLTWQNMFAFGFQYFWFLEAEKQLETLRKLHSFPKCARPSYMHIFFLCINWLQVLRTRTVVWVSLECRLLCRKIFGSRLGEICRFWPKAKYFCVRNLT